MHHYLASFSIVTLLCGCVDPYPKRSTVLHAIDWSPAEVDRVFGLDIATVEHDEFRCLVELLRDPFCCCSFVTTAEGADEWIRAQNGRRSGPGIRHKEYVRGETVRLRGFDQSGRIDDRTWAQYTITDSLRAVEWKGEAYKLIVVIRREKQGVRYLLTYMTH